MGTQKFWDDEGRSLPQGRLLCSNGITDPPKAEGKKRAFLVYQAGIANVFQVDCYNLSPYGREAKRLYQGDFSHSRAICMGLAIAGWGIHTASCNEAGDITDRKWTGGTDDAPFCDENDILNLNNGSDFDTGDESNVMDVPPPEGHVGH